MMDYNKKKIKILLTSFINTLYLDDLFNKQLFGDECKKKAVVAPMKLNKYIQKYGSIFYLLFYVSFLFQPFILLFQQTLYTSYLIFQLRISKKRRKKINCKTLFILTEDNVLKANKRLNLYADFNILTTPFNKYIVEKEYTDKIIESIHYLDIKTILNNYFFSLYSSIIFIKKFGYKNFLYTFNIFEWILLYDIVNKKIPREIEIVFSNQKDRWVTLFDKCVILKKTMIQHGTNSTIHKPDKIVLDKYIYIEEFNSWALNMPYKLSNIGFLYSFNRKEAIHLIKGEYKITPKYSFIEYNIKLKEYLSDKNIIFIIGNSNLYFQEEKFLIDNLDKDKFDILLKPHPVTNSNIYKKLEDRFSLIDYSPTANIILSYQSTLAYEYESLGYEVHYYNNLSDVQEIVRLLNERNEKPE